MTHDAIMAAAERLKAGGATEPRLARDPVNQPQVHTWLEAMGEANPVYRDTEAATALHGGPVAPPAMAQVWTMRGLGLPGGTDGDVVKESDPLHQMMGVLDEAGYASVLGTNCDQTYQRHLRPGDHVAVTTELESVVGPKRTGVGEGYFVTTRSVWWVDEEQVATMLFRVLKFQAAKRSTGPDLTDPARTVRPMVNRDTSYFWEGTAVGELRIQRCGACGTLRHPPGPLCPSCGATQREHVVSPGTGLVHSYVVHHAPQIPGKELPMVLAVVALDEGVRMIGEVRGLDPAEVDDSLIGTRVQVGFDRIDDELTLPVWQVEGSGSGGRALRRAQEGPASLRAPVETFGDLDELDQREGKLDHRGTDQLPAWELPVTTTLVVSTALATRDFQDVHHDRDLAQGHGSKDIFLNILTTTGLVQRYVGEWAGWASTVRSCELRLGAPAYPGDTLSFTGRVVEVTEEAGDPRHVVEVVGSVPMGAHVTARVVVTGVEAAAEVPA